MKELSLNVLDIAQNSIKAKAPKPPTVVNDEAPISGIALLRAAIVASIAGFVSF